MLTRGYRGKPARKGINGKKKTKSKKGTKKPKKGAKGAKSKWTRVSKTVSIRGIKVPVHRYNGIDRASAAEAARLRVPIGARYQYGGKSHCLGVRKDGTPWWAPAGSKTCGASKARLLSKRYK